MVVKYKIRDKINNIKLNRGGDQESRLFSSGNLVLLFAFIYTLLLEAENCHLKWSP